MAPNVGGGGAKVGGVGDDEEEDFKLKEALKDAQSEISELKKQMVAPE
jgi:hypothetical protein